MYGFLNFELILNQMELRNSSISFISPQELVTQVVNNSYSCTRHPVFESSSLQYHV